MITMSSKFCIFASVGKKSLIHMTSVWPNPRWVWLVRKTHERVLTRSPLQYQLLHKGHRNYCKNWKLLSRNEMFLSRVIWAFFRRTHFFTHAKRKKISKKILLTSAFGYWPHLRVRNRGDFFFNRRREIHYSQRKHPIIKVHVVHRRISSERDAESRGYEIRMIAAYINQSDLVRMISIRNCLLHQYHRNHTRLNNPSTWPEKSSCAWQPFWSDRLEYISVIIIIFEVLLLLLFSTSNITIVYCVE